MPAGQACRPEFRSSAPCRRYCSALSLTTALGQADPEASWLAILAKMASSMRSERDPASLQKQGGKIEENIPPATFTFHSGPPTQTSALTHTCVHSIDGAGKLDFWPYSV